MKIISFFKHDNVGWRGFDRVLLALLLLALAPLAFAVLGDVDNDGVIDATDVRMVLESVTGARTLTPTQQQVSDVDDTGVVDTIDAQWIEKFAQGIISEFPPQQPRSSSPIDLSRNGALLAITNPDNGSVSFLNTANDGLIGEVIIGKEPSSVHFSRSGIKAYVTDSLQRSLVVVDTESLLVTNSIPVGAEPFGVVVNHRGDLAFVANMMSDTVSVIDLSSESEITQVEVASKPQALTISADGSQLFVTHLSTALVSVINTQDLSVSQILLSEQPFNPQSTTDPAGVANRIKSIVFRPDTDEVWIPHILSNVKNTVETAFNTSIFPAVSIFDAATLSELPNQRMTLFAGIATTIASPEGLAFSNDGSIVYITGSASNTLTIVNASTRQQIGFVADVGNNPRGIVLHPDESRAYIFNRLSPTLTVVDLISETVAEEITLAPNLIADEILEGRRVFFSSATSELSRDRFMSCESCHFDGRDDGQTWLFSNGPRQTQTLAGDSTRSGLQHHNGDRANLQDFAIAFSGLQGGTGLTLDQLDNMAEFANVIRFLDNPNVSIDGAMSAEARLGRRLFRQRGCNTCHSGPFLTDSDGNDNLSSPLLHTVGTFQPGVGTQDGTDRTRDQDALAGGTVRPAGQFESSYLIGLHATPPYLHAGNATTLRETLTAVGNAQDLHGITLDLSETELDQMVAYMNSLDIRNRRIEITQPSDNSSVFNLTLVRGTTFETMQTLDLYIDDIGPIAAQINGNTFSATVPNAFIPSVVDGTPIDISARGTTSEGEVGRFDVEVYANFGASTDTTNSQMEAAPALVIADGVSTSIVTLTPRTSNGDLVGSGLTLEVGASLGSLGDVTDSGNGEYTVTFTSTTFAGVANITANVTGEAIWSSTVMVQVTAGGVDPATSSITATVQNIEADGLGTIEITVLPRDAFGNSLGEGQVVDVTTNLGSVGEVTDVGDGRYLAIYTAASSQGTATVNAVVNGTTLNLTPQIALQTDVTEPPPANSSAISFSSVVGGITTIIGGAGAAEGFSTVRVENVLTGQFALATASANGSFSVQLAVGVNQEVEVIVSDIAGNQSDGILVTPFIVNIPAIRGIVQSPLSGGGYTPVQGTTVVLFEIDLSNAPTITFNPLSISSVVSGADGSFEILLPNGFVPDPELVVATGPDANGDGFIESFDNYTYVNNSQQNVTVDVLGTTIINGIANNFFWLNGPSVPASHFTPTERLNIDSSFRTATVEQDFFGLDPSAMLGAIGTDIFFDANPDAADVDAKTIFELAAQSPGDSAPPESVNGQLTAPDGSGGSISLSNVQVQMGTLAFNNPPSCDFDICVDLITGAIATTDSNGFYQITVPGFVDPGSQSVIVALGELTYDNTGNPGPFVPGGTQYSLAGFYLASNTGVDVAGRSAANLIQLQGVPIENFNATEMTQLLGLIRTKIAGFSVVTANKTLTQVFVEIFNLLATDFDVVTLLADIADPQQNSDTSVVTANPVTLDADGVSISVISIEPRNELAQPVGPGRVITLTTTVGTITSPAIDNGDGFYTAFLTAPLADGSAIIAASLEGVTFDQQPVVTFIADVVAPPAPNANEILFFNVSNTATIIGLPGSVEPSSLVLIENVTQGLTVSVSASADGSFRADIAAVPGDVLSFRSEDLLGNTSNATNTGVPAGQSLPAIANTADIPFGINAELTPLSAGDFAASVPSNYNFVAGVSFDIQGSNTTEAITVIARSGQNLSPDDQVILAQELVLNNRTVWRVLAPVANVGGVLVPQNDVEFVGVREDAKLAYLSTATPIAFAYGVVSGERGPIGGTLVRLLNSEFEDLSRADGRYLLVGEVNNSQQFLSTQTWQHESASVREVLFPYANSKTQRDFVFATRADTTFGFTQRFNDIDEGQPDRIFIRPDGTSLYVMRKAAGDFVTIETDMLTDRSIVDNPQNILDFDFTPNGSEGFIAAFNRVRGFNAMNEQLGLEVIDIGFPRAVSVTPNGELSLVASSIDNLTSDTDPDAVFIIDTFSNVVEDTSLSISADPSTIRINRTGDRAYVLSQSNATMSVIDINARSVIDQMSLGVTPSDLAISHDGLRIYVTDAGSNQLLEIDRALAEDGIAGNEVINLLAVGGAPSSVTLHPDGVFLYVTEPDDDTISVIDRSDLSVEQVWAVTDQVVDLAIQPDGTRVYALDTKLRFGVMEIQARETDIIAPVVLDVGPRDRPQQLLQNSELEIVFSEPMDSLSINVQNIVVTDSGDQQIPGTISSQDSGVTAIFTPQANVRYVLNDTINVSVSNVTDFNGNSIESTVEATTPTFVMQLPQLALMSVDISEQGVVANGSAGAVEPGSDVRVTNLASGDVFNVKAQGDGSFSVSLVGLDNDGYQLVSSVFSGRAATNPVTIPVNFSIQFADPNLISYTPGPNGLLRVTGVPGAVDIKSTRLFIRDTSTLIEYQYNVPSPDGSFVLDIDAGQNVPLEIVTTLLDSVTLDPVTLGGHSFAAPVLNFVTPNHFQFGVETTITLVGQNFGGAANVHRITVDNDNMAVTLIDTVEGTGLPAAQFVAPAGLDAGLVRLRFAGQVSNGIPIQADRPQNTDPVGINVVESSVPDASDVLGFADSVAVNLGQGGHVVINLGTTVRQGSGADLRIFEDSSDGEDCYNVSASILEAGPYVELGQFCGTQAIQLVSIPFAQYIRLEDADDGGNAASIDAVQVLNIKMSILIGEVDQDGQLLRQFSNDDSALVRTITVTPTPADVGVCPTKSKDLSVTVNPPNTREAYYTPGCEETITWTIESGTGSLTSSEGSSTTFEASDAGGRTVIKVEVVRVPESSGASCADTGTATVDVEVVEVSSVDRVISDQFSGNECNPSSMAEFYMAARADGKGYLVGQTTLAGQQKDDLALIATKHQGEIVMDSSTPIDPSNKTPFSFDITGNDLSNQTVVAGCDANEDGELQNDEITATANYNARITTMEHHSGRLNFLRFGTMFPGGATRRLETFTTGNAHGAAVSAHSITAASLTHQVGAIWPPSCTRGIPKYTYTPPSVESTAAASGDSLLIHVINAATSSTVETAIEAALAGTANDTVTVGPFGWSGGAFSLSTDPDLYFTYGTLAAGSLQGTYSVTAKRTFFGSWRISGITFDGSFEDDNDYNFNHTNGGALSRAGATVQMGHGTLGTNSGEVFRTRVEFEDTFICQGNQCCTTSNCCSIGIIKSCL